MKKVLAILLVLGLLASVMTGCGGDTDPHSDTTNNQTENTEPPREAAQTAGYTAAESFAGGSGTESDPFQISEAGHLVLLHEMLKKEEEGTNFDDTYVKGYYVLTADISLNDASDFDNRSTNAPKYGWEPVGAGLSLNSFAGVLDGNGHKITGMFIDADTSGSDVSSPSYGLFADMEGTVKNLMVEQSYIRVSGGNVNVGTIAGSTGYKEAVIENCAVSSVIEMNGTCEVGGIVGKASGSTVTGCTSASTITQLDDGVSHIGGISGSDGSIVGCTFTGTLSGKGDTGGIVGYGDMVKDSVNKGSVSGERAGGISGNAFNAGMGIEIEITQRNIEGCTNEGNVTGTLVAGGIVGLMDNGESDISLSVIDCENKGLVRCDESAAGIIGQLTVERTGTIKVENCVNHADITGKGKTGGIISDLTGGINNQQGEVVISGCKNLGSITSEDLYSAGIITYLLVMGEETDLRLTVENCANEGAIQSVTCAGGILGFSNVGFNSETSDMSISDATKVSVSGCCNSGSVTVLSSNSMAGGIVGVLGLGYISTDIIDCANTGAVTVDFTLTDEQIEESQGMEWPEFYQIAGGVVGRIGDAIKLTTAEGVEISADNVNAPEGNIVISGCRSTGTVSAPDYSFILNKGGKPLYVNYLGGVVGQCSATNGYAFSVENSIYSGAERGLGSTDFSDVGTKN